MEDVVVAAGVDDGDDTVEEDEKEPTLLGAKGQATQIVLK